MKTLLILLGILPFIFIGCGDDKEDIDEGRIFGQDPVTYYNGLAINSNGLVSHIPSGQNTVQRSTGFDFYQLIMEPLSGFNGEAQFWILYNNIPLDTGYWSVGGTTIYLNDNFNNQSNQVNNLGSGTAVQFSNAQCIRTTWNGLPNVNGGGGNTFNQEIIFCP